MTIDELNDNTKAGFMAVQQEFAAVQQEFATVQQEFAAVQREFTAVRTEMKTEAAAVRSELRAEIVASAANVTDTLRAEIRAEGETTRRHFDIVAEQFREWTTLVADGTVRNTDRLDDHERRISAIETQRPSR